MANYKSKYQGSEIDLGIYKTTAIPSGGTTGQVLSKVDGTDYNTKWIDQSQGLSLFQESTINLKSTLTPSSNSGNSGVILSSNSNPSNDTSSDVSLSDTEANLRVHTTGTANIGISVTSNGTKLLAQPDTLSDDSHVVTRKHLNSSLSAIHSIPSGGTAGQVLSKVNGTNYNVQWITPSAGGSTEVKLYSDYASRLNPSTYIQLDDPSIMEFASSTDLSFDRTLTVIGDYRKLTLDFDIFVGPVRSVNQDFYSTVICNITRMLKRTSSTLPSNIINELTTRTMKISYQESFDVNSVASGITLYRDTPYVSQPLVSVYDTLSAVCDEYISTEPSGCDGRHYFHFEVEWIKP